MNNFYVLKYKKIKIFFNLKFWKKNLDDWTVIFKNYFCFDYITGKPLVDLIGIDEDKNAVTKFEILDDPSGFFRLNNKSLVSTVVLDYEKNTTVIYSILFRGTDMIAPTSAVSQFTHFQMNLLCNYN